MNPRFDMPSLGISSFRIRLPARLWVPVAVLVFWIAVAVGTRFVAPYPPNTINPNVVLQPPSLQHLCGTDQLGRDIFSRILYGTRDALMIAISSVISGAGVGTLMGIVAGYHRGKLEWAVMRLTDTLLAIPSIVIAMVIITILGQGVPDLILAIGLSEVPIFIRLARGSTLSIREMPYVEAARAAGASTLRIVARHIFGNVLGSVVVLGVIDMGASILAVAGLTFIGLGPPPPSPEWGSMITQAQQYIPQDWWMAIFPGLAIISAVLALNLVADGLKPLIDPRLKR